MYPMCLFPLHIFPIYDYMIFYGRNFSRKCSVNAVIFQQMCQGSGVAKIIDGHHFNRWMVQQKPEKAAAYSSEAVNCNFRLASHGLVDMFLGFVRGTYQCAAFYMAESHFQADLFVFLELIGCDELFYRQMPFAGL